jgi:carbonic anhydrase
MSAYQSPIKLNPDDTIKINQFIDIHGENYGATFNKTSKIYEINDKIILIIDDKKYKLVEYHFHINGEHNVNDQIYDSEVHYVFIELNELYNEYTYKCHDICGGVTSEYNTLVIGRVICNKHERCDLTILNVKLPSVYYEYDGSLTTGTYAPVRWIIGKNSIQLNINDIKDVAKPARQLQSLDGRIILYSD